MKITKDYMNAQILARNISLDAQFSASKAALGATFQDPTWIVRLWQPLAKGVVINIYDQTLHQIASKPGQLVAGIWVFTINEDVEGAYYDFKITHPDDSVTWALDPYAKSMAPFNWKSRIRPRGAFIKKAAAQSGPRPQDLVQSASYDRLNPLIYEANLRDLTALQRTGKHRPGTFLALQSRPDIIKHLQSLGVTHVQFLPLNACYALDEMNLKIVNKGQGQKWLTNYNWGYDPHNYFTLAGWYASEPRDPYARIREFKMLIDTFHAAGIGVIMDVVYNHTMHNTIFNNILPGYYYRTGSKVYPVAAPALATERTMVRKLIVDSLLYLVQEFNVDGFRFDLLSFMDLATIKVVTKKLRKVKPALILHGEAWRWNDIGYENSYVKGTVDNNKQFAYFNDTTRNAIKGDDDPKNFSAGLVSGNLKYFDDYLTSIVGNLRQYRFPQPVQATSYQLFTKHIGTNLQYVACHDGLTLWDKVNLTTPPQLAFKLAAYRQALIMLFTTQGRKLLQGGIELLYTKPHDQSGEAASRAISNANLIDFFKLQPDHNAYHENSYKMTDYVNGIRWEALTNPIVKTEIYRFLQKLIQFYQTRPFFRLTSSAAIQKQLTFTKIDAKTGIVIFKIKSGQQRVEVVHNFGTTDFAYKSAFALQFSSSLKRKKHVVKAHASHIYLQKTL